MSFSTEEQRIYDWLKGSLPAWFFQQARAEEELGALVKIVERVRQAVAYYREQSAILTADGPVSTDPDWLEQHARDRGTARASGESDDQLRYRLRHIVDALTLPYLLSLIGTMLTDAGVAGSAAIVELRRDRAFFVTRQRIQGTASGADAFTKAGTTMTLTLAGQIFQGGMLYWGRPSEPCVVTIAGATSGANNGDFQITGFDGDSMQFTNAAGVAEVYGGTWTIGAKHHNRKDAYFSRGYRMGAARQGFVTILPFGTTEALRLAIHEAIRQRKAAGVHHVTERRAVP